MFNVNWVGLALAGVKLESGQTRSIDKERMWNKVRVVSAKPVSTEKVEMVES